MTLPPIDQAEIEAFWSRAIAAGAVAAGTRLPAAVERFGDGVALADELLALVLHGPKRATAGALAEFGLDDEPLPEVDGMWIACDGNGRPRALLRTTDVRVGPLSSVDDTFAWDEGEGDRTRATWLADHETYFKRALPAMGLTFSSEMPTVFERFDMPYSE